MVSICFHIVCLYPGVACVGMLSPASRGALPTFILVSNSLQVHAFLEGRRLACYGLASDRL